MTGALVITRTDVPDSLPEMMQAAKFLKGSVMLPDHLRDDEQSLVLVMMKARALNLPMATAFEHVLVVEGRTSMSGVLMQALTIRAGFNLFLTERTDEYATVRAERPGIGEDGRGYDYVTFSLEDAERADLIYFDEQGKVRSRSKLGNKPKPWELYTKDMLYWRAISRAAKFYFGDVLLGVVHLPDEIGGQVGADGRPIPATITVDVSEEIKAYIFRVGRAESSDALREIYDEVREAGMLSSLSPKGATLSQVIAAKKREVVTAEKAAAKASAQTGGATEDESSTGVVSEQGPKNPESGFDRLDAEDPEVDPAQLANTPRRRGVLKLATEVFNDPDAAAMERFGRPLAEVPTLDLQDWLVAARKAARA